MFFDGKNSWHFNWIWIKSFLFDSSRHCGRNLCSKCSSNEIPILKFQINKPVRVCSVCFEVLQVGSD